eukprot:2198873-Rhodomonas_salina.2
MVFHESSEHGQGGTIPDTFKVSEVPPDNRIHHELSEDGDDHHELSNHLSKKKQGGRGCYIAVGGRFRTVVDCTCEFPHFPRCRQNVNVDGLQAIYLAAFESADDYIGQ